MQNKVKFRIKTLSNLFIGGAPIPFEIGGIDQKTAVDVEKLPCIPGSSFKGALRAIVREDDSTLGREISQIYTEYLEEEKKEKEDSIQALTKEIEAQERIGQRYNDAIRKSSPEYLFGIEGFNNTPKLFFSDLLLCDELRDEKMCFSIDMKNSIDVGGDAPVSNPRTYKTARSGLVFEGEIELYRIDKLPRANAMELCKRYIIYSLLKFNNGIYRLGNSKSRGYGKVEAIIENKNGELKE